jgi:hypothetical protein
MLLQLLKKKITRDYINLVTNQSNKKIQIE